MKQVHYRAAGGIVLDSAGRVLLLQRDVVRAGTNTRELRLPKGHIEPGESDEQAAVREVAEESGYFALELLCDLGSHEHSFEHDGEAITRKEHYYLMRLTSDERRAPTATGEEALFVPVWVEDLR